MKLGIMQPYLFPYIGYFQLINVVDKFVIYDDVNFIKQGWINRNRILNQNNALTFTVPLEKAGSFIKINEVKTNEKLYNGWKEKFLKTIELNYKRAPYFSETRGLIEKVLSQNTNSVSELAVSSLLAVCDYLDVRTEFVLSSTVYNNQDLSGKDRVIDICKREHATHYINPIGGQALYSEDEFRDNGLALGFIQSLSISYNQLKNDFVPWLSIVDVLMFNSTQETRILLDRYEII